MSSDESISTESPRSESADDRSSSEIDESSPVTTPESGSPRLAAKEAVDLIPETLSESSSISYDGTELHPKIPKSEPTQPLSTDAQTPDHWIARDERMIRLTGKHPFNVEAPLDALYNAGFLTPQNLFYVRTHGDTPQVSPKQAQEWKLRIHGLVEHEMEFSIQDLKEQFPVVTLPVTLVCAGNRRKEQNMVLKGLGFNWGAAGVSTGLFTGVYLADILRRCKPKNPLLYSYPSYDTAVPGRARHVIFEGADELPKGKYGTSQRLQWALDHNKGMLIAWGLNGEPLSPDHGYPLRLVVPGQIGGRMVKWLQRIEVSDRESQHYLHFFDNKLLPTVVTPDQARSEDKWWYDPKYIINELNVNAAICSPGHDELLRLAPKLAPAQTIPVEGYAYTGGGRRITRVEITLDDGKTWALASITYPEDSYRAHPIQGHPFFGKLDLSMTEMSFCWCFWRLEVPMESLLTDGNAGHIAVRAMDEALSIMPRDMYWNAMSMMNSWWFRVAVHKEQQEDGARVLRFEHPTVAGNTDGGWMQRMNNARQDPRILRFKSVSDGNVSAEVSSSLSISAQGSATPQDGPTEEAAESAMVDPAKLSTTITAAQLAEHGAGNEAAPWFVVHGQVYDATNFLQDHPGGDQSIRLVAGEDATEDFMAIHSMDAKKMLREYHVGMLQQSEPEVKTAPAAETGNRGASLGSTATSTPHLTVVENDASRPFLEPNTWKKVRLASKIPISHDSRIFRFALQHQDQEIGLPVGQHVYLRVKTTNKATGKVETVQRAYTPYSCSTQRGFVDILIKVYFPSAGLSETAAPFAGGRMSMLLESMTASEQANTDDESNTVLELKGPIGHFTYMGDGLVQRKQSSGGGVSRVKKLAMIAGGSGITPIWSTLRAIVEEYKACPPDERCDAIQIWLIYGNRTEKDILIRQELDNLCRELDGNLNIWHILSSDIVDQDWKMGRGHIGLECLRSHLPPAPSSACADPDDVNSLALVCGPPLMEKAVVSALQELGWDPAQNIIIF